MKQMTLLNKRPVGLISFVMPALKHVYNLPLQWLAEIFMKNMWKNIHRNSDETRKSELLNVKGF